MSSFATGSYAADKSGKDSNHGLSPVRLPRPHLAVTLFMPDASELKTWRGLALLATLALVVVAIWIASLSGRHVANDDGHNVTAAYNLAYHGVFSGDRFVPEPDNYREPLPPILLAGMIKALAYLDGPRDDAFFRAGPGARFLKLSNILWGMVLCASVFAAIMILTRSMVLAAAGTLFAGMNFEADTYLTETAAAALLALASLLLVLAIKTDKARHYALAGLVLGALILTRAAFQYVALVLLAGLAVWFIMTVRQGASARGAALNWLALAIGVLIAVAPWMVRNYAYLGSPQITQRAGIVLLTRAIKNEMTPTEYVGSFYAWAPRGVRPLAGKLLGFGKEDLHKNGRLQRLNRGPSDFQAEDKAAESAGRPEDAISYYVKARAERTKLKRQLAAEGVPERSMRADAELQSRAMRMILADPLKHLAMTPPFLWRGAAHEAPLFALVAGLALWWRRGDLLVYVMPAILMIAFYTLFSHNIPRYNNPAFGVLIAAVIATGYRLFLSRTGRAIP